MCFYSHIFSRGVDENEEQLSNHSNKPHISLEM